MFQFSVLASGSSGNALYIQTPSVRLLIDAGISGRELDRRLRSVAGVSLKDIDVLLLTHEHVDHIRGLRQVLKTAAPQVYATEGTWAQVARQAQDHAPRSVSWVKAGDRFSLMELTISVIPVSHDAEEPVAYRIDGPGGGLAVVTDLGYFSEAVKRAICGCRCVVLETNHDVEMLRAGRYPWTVKRRILGDKGHLSNEDAAYGLAEVLDDQLVDVYLAHLSEENNLPELAELTVRSVLSDVRRDALEQVQLHRTSRTEPTPLRALVSMEEAAGIPLRPGGHADR